MMMKVSVVIPTYKPGNYLQDCLQSLENQTLSKDHYEVIVVLNGCGDPWRKQVECWLSECTMPSVFIHTDTPGVCHARNMGIEQAKGEYLVFVDDDDWVSENFLQGMLGHASPDTVVTSSVIGYRDVTGEYLADYYLARKFDRICMGGGKTSINQGRSFLSSSCFKLIPRSVIGTRRFNPRYKLGEDALFMAELTDRISFVEMSEPDAVYYRRLRDGSASHTMGRTAFPRLLWNAVSLSGSYMKVYLRKPFRYNCAFFATRIMAGFTKRLFCYN